MWVEVALKNGLKETGTGLPDPMPNPEPVTDSVKKAVEAMVKSCLSDNDCGRLPTADAST